MTMFMVVYVSCYDKVDFFECVVSSSRLSGKGELPHNGWGLMLRSYRSPLKVCPFTHLYLWCAGVFMWVVVSLCMSSVFPSTCCVVLNALCLYVCCAKVTLRPSPRCWMITFLMHVQELFTTSVDPKKISRPQCGRNVFPSIYDVLCYVIRFYC